MAILGLEVTQRVAYKVTTKRKHNDAVADNLLNQNFNPVTPNQVWAGLKHDWLLKVPQPTREHMRNDVTVYMRYYNLERLYTANGDLSPVEYEQSSLRKVS